MVTCPEIGHIHNGTYNSTARKYGTTIEINCDYGFFIPREQPNQFIQLTAEELERFRSLVLQCSEHGEWAAYQSDDVIIAGFDVKCERMYYAKLMCLK